MGSARLAVRQSQFVEHESALTCRALRISLGAASKSRAPRYAAPWYRRGWEYCRRQPRSGKKGYVQVISKEEISLDQR